MRQVFVTGGSGFVGGAAISRFLADGWRVRAMSRSAKSDEKIRGLRAEPVRCDLENVAADHIADADFVMHAGAFLKAWGPKDAWDRINVRGTERMLTAARAAGVSRFIHIGTEAALLHGQHLHDADETAPLALDSPIPYCRTKALAEHAVREADDSANGFTTIVLRPRFIWGPGDTTLLPGIAAMAQRGAWMWINRGAAVTSTTHISNLVEAIALACERGEGGEAYFVLDDGIHTLREIISGMAASRELTLPDRSIPAWVADAAGAVCEWVWRTLSLKDAPPLTKQIAMLMSRDCTLCDDKARAQLGYVPVLSVDDGLRELREASPASAKRY
jgi:nucleoside-diphosphate-sugar epimerase